MKLILKLRLLSAFLAFLYNSQMRKKNTFSPLLPAAYKFFRTFSHPRLRLLICDDRFWQQDFGRGISRLHGETPALHLAKPAIILLSSGQMPVSHSRIMGSHTFLKNPSKTRGASFSGRSQQKQSKCGPLSHRVAYEVQGSLMKYRYHL